MLTSLDGLYAETDDLSKLKRQHRRLGDHPRSSMAERGCEYHSQWASLGSAHVWMSSAAPMINGTTAKSAINGCPRRVLLRLSQLKR